MIQACRAHQPTFAKFSFSVKSPLSFAILQLDWLVSFVWYNFELLNFLGATFHLIRIHGVKRYMLGCTDSGPTKTLVQDLQRSRLFAPGWNWSCEPGVTIGGESPSHHHHHHHHRQHHHHHHHHVITITIKTMFI